MKSVAPHIFHIHCVIRRQHLVAKNIGEDMEEALNAANHENSFPRRHRSSQGVERKKQNFHSFIVASFNAQSVKGNDMACNRCEVPTFIKDKGVVLFFCERNMA